MKFEGHIQMVADDWVGMEHKVGKEHKFLVAGQGLNLASVY